MLNEELNLYDIEIDPSKKYFKYKKQVSTFIGLIFILCILGAIWQFVIKYYQTNLQKNKVEVNTEINYAVDNTNNQKVNNDENKNKTENGYVSDELYDGIYKHYVDNKYNFYCAYPAHFKVGDSIGGGNRITLISPDGNLVMFIGAVQNNLKLSAKDIMDQYVIDSGGKVDYKDHGDTWYAVSNKIGSTSYYRKCFVDDLIYWFEFDIKEGSNEEIGKYIEYVEDNFKKIETTNKN